MYLHFTNILLEHLDNKFVCSHVGWTDCCVAKVLYYIYYWTEKWSYFDGQRSVLENIFSRLLSRIFILEVTIGRLYLQYYLLTQLII